MKYINLSRRDYELVMSLLVEYDRDMTAEIRSDKRVRAMVFIRTLTNVPAYECFRAVNDLLYRKFKGYDKSETEYEISITNEDN